MGLELITDKESRENILEGLKKRVRKIESITARAPYEYLLQQEMKRYREDYGQDYKFEMQVSEK